MRLTTSARRAAEATDKPILNGGDGANQHPTQTLLDLFTIQETQKKLTGLSIALAGDLKKRGFKFLGPTVVYAHMQAIGMVNDHTRSCFRHNELKNLVK